MSLNQFNHWLTYVSLAASAGLVARLTWLGLARKYGWLAGYFLVDILQTVLTIGSSNYSMWYGYVYFSGQALKSVVAIGLSVQLWLLALRGYPGVARYGRRAALYMLLGTLLLALGGLLLEPARSSYQNGFPHYFNAIDGALDSMVGLFLVAATLFLLWFPVEVPRNVAFIIAGFVFYLAQNWASLLVVNLHPKSADSVSTSILVLDLACLIFWNAGICVRGETSTTVTGHRWNPQETERLLDQLDAINQRLEEVSR